MLSLRLFGGLSLTSSEDQVPVRASQRRRLALLAVLAMSRWRPVGRDKLAALFWPDSDSDRGRHLLADSIYVLRDALGEDVLLTTGDSVSLNPLRVDSDVSVFADALERRDLARAVGIYSEGGPFLDGVHLSDAPEFERWADSTSRQLAGDYRRALESLAKADSSRGNHLEAVAWWRKLAAEERSSSRVALELMRALEASGDVAGALEFAGVHEKIVRAEIDSTPDPSVIAFANELRARGNALVTRRPAGTAVRDGREPTTSEKSALVPAASISAAQSPEAISPESPHPRRRALVWGLAIVALLAMGYGALRFRARPNVSRDTLGRGPSIAVLPLRNLSPGADNESFADGMTEELITSLAKISRLQVIASTSAFAFKGHHTDVRKIADSLRVSHVLEGGIQRVGSRVRLSVRLVDATDGSTKWSQAYDRDIGDVFGMEDEIGRAVAGQLRVQLLGVPQHSLASHYATNAVAYDFYLHGRHQRELRNDTAFKAAIEYFERAIGADSSYAPAYAALSEVCTLLGSGQNSREYPRIRLYERAQAAASKALSLDDSLPEAHLALGVLRIFYQIDLSKAERELRRAVDLNPADRMTRQYLSVVFDVTGRPDEGLAQARQAEALDPLSVTAVREVGVALFDARRYDEAITELNRSRSLGPPVRTAPLILAQVYAKKGMFPQAILELRRASSNSNMGSHAYAFLGYALARSGNRTEAAQILSRLISNWRAGTGAAFDVATVYAGLGDYDDAFSWIDKSFDDGSVRVGILGPTYDDLRADPRFQRVRSRLGFQKL